MTRKTTIARLKEAAERMRSEDEEDYYDPHDPDADPAPSPGERKSGSTAAAEPPRPDAAARIEPMSAPTTKAPARDRVHTSIYLTRDTWRQLRIIAAAEDCKVNELLIEAIADFVEKRMRARRPELSGANHQWSAL